MVDLPAWLNLDDAEVARIVAQKATTAVVYLNGTRRWFLSQNKAWADYGKVTGMAHRALCQMMYDHGLQTLIQPLMGYDLLDRGPQYIQMAVRSLLELTSTAYRSWYRQTEVRVTLYGNWSDALTDLGFNEAVDLLHTMTETSYYTKRKLLLGVFADEGLDNIIRMAKAVGRGEALLHRYYGQPVGSVDLIIGSGQPAIWDLPLLDINKASLYFIQAPTFCLGRDSLRQILHDHIFQRINDDELYGDLVLQEWEGFEILGLGQRSRKGWTPT
jgi:hypothetical protein